MKDFVFIIPLTPSNLQSAFRRRLFEIAVSALKSQKSDNWQALLVGEYEKIDGNLVYIPAVISDPDYKKHFRKDERFTDKHFKIDVALRYINSQAVKPKYLIRLDDDDIISPTAISRITDFSFDCYADKYQALIDSMTGKICFGEYPWFANTIIHKYEHSVTIVPVADEYQPEGSLINGRHDVAFHKYYSDKKVFYSSKLRPLYLRTLTMDSISINKRDDNLRYSQWIKSYGAGWYYHKLDEFEPYVSEILKLSSEHFNAKPIRDFSFFGFVKNLATEFFQKLSTSIKSKLKLS